MAQQQAIKVVVVAPAEGKLGDLVSHLQTQGYQVVGCADTDEITQAFTRGPADLVIGMVSEDPVRAKEFVQRCRATSKDIAILLLVDEQDILEVAEAVRRRHWCSMPGRSRALRTGGWPRPPLPTAA
jgi:DNA-binding NtrC family response regulator